MVYLQLEALDPENIKTDLSVAYIDHNTLQSGFENADDHEFIRTCARKYGIVFSKPGGGICHQVHLERFAKPGQTLIGSDSHTPTAGGLGALAIGAGGWDGAVGMAKGSYSLTMPRVINIRLHGSLPKAVNAKDVILAVLQRLTVKGGVGAVMEYSGDGLAGLSVTDRATICNMGAELGATTSIFPSDEKTLDYLTRMGRPEDFQPLVADEDAVYDEVYDIDLGTLQPLAAKPHSPDNVASIAEIAPIKVDQVAVGSCTNSSYSDMMRVARILEGRTVHPNVSLVIAPGSSTILAELASNGALSTMIAAGARILESACGPCIGMGQSPNSGAVSLRTFNRNFKGRSGTIDAEVYLVSPETAAWSAVQGVLSDPRDLADVNLDIEQPERFSCPDAYFIVPETCGQRPADPRDQEIIMGPNIKPFPIGKPLTDQVAGSVLLKTGDNVTTDDIVPSHAKLLPYRSNVPYLAEFCFGTLASDFKQRAEKAGGGFVVGGDNYGQGSSREHAALVPLYLGVRAVLAKSFARIHRSNLINAGILPLTFSCSSDYDELNEGDRLRLEGLLDALENGRLTVVNETQNTSYTVELSVSEHERKSLLAGGYLNAVKASI